MLKIKLFSYGQKSSNKARNWKKLLYFAILIAGIPCLFEFLIDVITNSLIIIIENDQKGIIWLIQSQVKRIKINILSANGSIVVPMLVFKLYFLAINPSIKSETPPTIIRTQTKLLKFISKKRIIGNINNILKIVIKLGMFLVEKICFNTFVFNRFIYNLYILYWIN